MRGCGSPRDVPPESDKPAESGHVMLRTAPSELRDEPSRRTVREHPRRGAGSTFLLVTPGVKTVLDERSYSTTRATCCTNDANDTLL
jgi:hypothetical protein